MVKWMDMENTFGLINQLIKAGGKTIISMAMVSINGVMVEFIKDSGNRVNRMVMEYIISLILILNVDNGRMVKGFNGLKINRLLNRFKIRLNRMLINWISSF